MTSDARVPHHHLAVRRHRAALPRLLALAALPPLVGCSGWLLSSHERTDRSRPIALVETTGGVEYGATTEFGILTLGRSASDGPCRVHYFLGPTPLVEDGEVERTGSAFCRATIDLKTQHLRVFDHPPGPEDELVAMWTADGVTETTVAVTLAADAGVEGDVLADPGTPLPPGAAIFALDRGDLRFVGLVSGHATLAGKGGARSYYTFAGVDRVRELLAIPELHPADYSTHFRPDNISVERRMK